MVSPGGILSIQNRLSKTQEALGSSSCYTKPLGCEIPIADCIPSLTEKACTEGVCTIAVLGAGERL